MFGQKCPVNFRGIGLKANTDLGFEAKGGVSDLNRKQPLALAFGFLSTRSWHVSRQNAVRAGYGLPAVEDLPSHRGSLQRRSPAVRTQIWIAICVYVLVAIIKKQLKLDVSLHTLLQILSLTLFEKLPLRQAVADIVPINNDIVLHNQLKLFEF